MTGRLKSIIISAVMVMAAMPELFAQQPLFIDKEGNVYIKVKEGNKKLSVAGYAEFLDSVRAGALKVDNLVTANQLKANQLFVTGITALSESVKLAGGLSIEGNGSVPGNLLVKGGSELQGNLAIAAPGRLEFAQVVQKRKINLWSSTTNDNQFYGFGIDGGTLRYQVDNVQASHVFYSANSETTSRELMRIKGNGNVGIGNDNPQSALDVAGNIKATTINGEKAPLIYKMNPNFERNVEHTVRINEQLIKGYLGDEDGGTIKLICRHLTSDKHMIKIACIRVYVGIVNNTVAVSVQQPNGQTIDKYLNQNPQDLFTDSWPTFSIRASNNYNFDFKIQANWECTIIVYDR